MTLTIVLTLTAGIFGAYTVISMLFASILLYSEYMNPNTGMYLDAIISAIMWPLLLFTLVAVTYKRNQSIKDTTYDLFGFKSSRK